MYSILIMGGSDFVGSSLAKYLIENKHNVDILTRGIKPINYKGIHKHIICDRKNQVAIAKNLESKKYDYIFDMSAEDKDDVKILLQNIDCNSLNKYILLSPMEINNRTITKYQRDSIKNKKNEIEKYVEKTSSPYIIIRASHIYGDKNIISNESYFFHQIEKSNPIKIPQNISIRTQFIYIDDFVRVLYSIMRSSHVRKTYNVTNPQVITFEDYINTLGDVMGIAPNIKYVDNISKIDLDLKEHFDLNIENNYLSIDKVIQDGIYIPNILLNKGIVYTYEWYKRKSKEKVSIKKKLERVLQIG